MDLKKMKNEDKLSLCRWYYRVHYTSDDNPTKLLDVPGGFFLLPFLWCVNAIWFFSEAFRRPAYKEQVEIKAYVVRSAIGAFFWGIILITWIVVFQVKRAEWGELADDLSFVIPTGIP